MSTYKSTGCKVCGEACHGSRCQQCQRMKKQESQDLTFTDYECPDCGGTTSGQGVTCYQCRGED